MKFVKFQYLFSPEKYLILQKQTPCFVFQKNILLERLREYSQAIKGRALTIQPYYAIKSNPHKQVLKSIASFRGFGLDASSLQELKLAKEAGAKKIVFTGPGKSASDMLYAIRNFKNLTIHLDSFEELKKLNSLKLTRPINVGVRVHTKGMGAWNKFGINLQELKDFYNLSLTMKHINLVGLHFHNSWNTSSGPYIKSLNLIKKCLVRDFTPTFLRNLKFIDIGGGLYGDKTDFLLKPSNQLNSPNKFSGYNAIRSQNIDSFFQDISNYYNSELKKLMPNIIFITEPGRWVSSHIFHILTKVMDKKKNDYIILDGGTDNFGVISNKYYYPAVNLTNTSRNELRTKMAGSLCASSDMWGYFCYARNIEINDIILFPFQGAYTYSLSTDFIKGSPRVYEI